MHLRGGRGGQGRGRGSNNNGRGGTWNNQRGYNNAPHPVKTHENNYYCYSHGFDVEHPGQQCPNPVQGHLPWLTAEMKRTDLTLPEHQQRYYYASYKGEHKTILPTQAAVAGFPQYAQRGQPNNYGGGNRNYQQSGHGSQQGNQTEMVAMAADGDTHLDSLGRQVVLKRKID